MENSTQLAKVDATIIPKPTRKEIIAALVEVARKEHGDKMEAANLAKEASKKALDRAILKHFTKSAAVMRAAISGASISVYRHSIDLTINMDAKDMPDEIKALCETHNKAEAVWIRPFGERAMQCVINNKLNGMESTSSRVAKLAESEEISALYKHITQPAQ